MTETHYVVDILILLTAAVIAVPLFQRLGLGAVLGFLVAGTVVGPWGLGFIIGRGRDTTPGGVWCRLPAVYHRHRVETVPTVGYET